jgi:hypothetical protein
LMFFLVGTNYETAILKKDKSRTGSVQEQKLVETFWTIASVATIWRHCPLMPLDCHHLCWVWELWRQKLTAQGFRQKKIKAGTKQKNFFLKWK